MNEKILLIVILVSAIISGLLTGFAVFLETRNALLSAAVGTGTVMGVIYSAAVLIAWRKDLPVVSY